MLWTAFHEQHKVAVLADEKKKRPTKEIGLCCHSAEQTSTAYVMIGLIESNLIRVSYFPSEQAPPKKDIQPAGANENEKPKCSISYHRTVDSFQAKAESHLILEPSVPVWY